MLSIKPEKTGIPAAVQRVKGSGMAIAVAQVSAVAPIPQLENDLAWNIHCHGCSWKKTKTPKKQKQRRQRKTRQNGTKNKCKMSREEFSIWEIVIQLCQ